MWLSNNRVLGVRLRHEVSDLDGQLPVHPHLLHHLVEEVLLLGVRAGGEDRLEVVEQGGAVELRAWNFEGLAT